MRAVGAIQDPGPDDLVTLRNQIQAELTNLDPAIAACKTLDAPTLATWQTTRGIVQHWIDTVNTELGGIFPSFRIGELYEQGQGLEKVLRLNWWPTLTAAGCPPIFPQPGAPPPPALSSDNPSSPFAWIPSLEGTLKVIAFLMIWREVKEWIE
jgi:hypothetical protein